MEDESRDYIRGLEKGGQRGIRGCTIVSATWERIRV